MAIHKVLSETLYTILTLLTVGLFFSGLPFFFLDQKGRPSLKCLTYPTIMTLGTVIPYPKKFQKIYKSRDTTLEFC